VSEPTWRVITGDSTKIKIPDGISAVVSDPPYGISFDTDFTRFSKDGKPRGGHNWRPVAGDTTPFDPSPWLTYPKVALFGANCFSDKLPIGSWLIWIKKRDSKLGKFLGDAEPCWINSGHGVYVHRHEWDGFLMEGEPRRKRHHATEKPVAVMKWVMDRLRIPAGATVLDPYCGSGSTGVACIETGRNFIGIEIDKEYSAVARKRIRDAERKMKATDISKA
jgi:site-specific DNA-methyltransferase (adenine-specific)